MTKKNTSTEVPLSINKQQKGLLRIWKAFLYSWDGLKITWKDEPAFRMEFIALLVAIPVTFLLPILLLTKILLISTVVWMLVIELINSAVEATVDLITEAHHPLAKKAKDTASAAVFVSVVISLIFWAIVLFSCFIFPLAEF